MKSKTILYMLFLLVIKSFASSPKADISFMLPKEWKFQTGDNPEYSKPEFNDQTWKAINVEKFWETQGYPDYDGIGWYRTVVVIPSTLKMDNSSIRAVKIFLGRIDDADETYLNGKLIGSSFGWETDRVYLIPIEFIHWDKENVLAVRVTDNGGNGGMYGSDHSIRKVKLSDVAIFTSNNKPSRFIPDGITHFEKVLNFKFKIPVDKLAGTIKVRICDIEDNTVVYEKNEPIIIGNKADSSYNVSVELKKPANYRIDYKFVTDFLPDTLKYSSLFAYKLSPRQNEKLEHPLVKPIIPAKSAPFGLENITFGGYLNERLNANLTQRLLQIDEPGILECYYNRPGKQTWVGEYVGKYLHAASRVWRSTKNSQLKAQMDRIVDILIACQNEDGYLGTYLPANYWTDWDVWSHKYNMLGLLSYYSATGYQPALEASKKIGDLLCNTFGENIGQRNIIKSSEHIGLASTSVLEPMTDLYRYTGDKKYLDFCNYIIKAYDFENGPKIISTLTLLGKVDKTADGKAYEMMSNLTGIVKLYQLTDDEKLLKAAENAWNDVSTYKLYISGTTSKAEHFSEDFDLPAGNDAHMGEGCVTVTWIQFSQALYYLTGNAKYINEIEKSIYNHLLAAENPETGCVSYYTALQGIKPYKCSIDGNCCLASVPSGIAAIPELSFTKNTDNGFNINIYSAEKLNDKIIAKDGKEVIIKCTVDSKFPEEGKASIRLNSDVKSKFLLALHVPDWCTHFNAIVDGKKYIGIPGQYLNIEKVWDKNSTVLVSFDLNVQILDGGKSYPGFIALKVGPQVLAVDQTLNPEIKELDKLSFKSPKLLPLSKTLLPKDWVGSQLFTTKAYYEGKTIDIKMVPFADAGQTDGDIRVWIKRK